MEVILEKKLKKKVKIIEGFPGLGLVGTIATDFLIDHLNAKPVGMIKDDIVAPLVAIHDKKVINPMGFYYDEKRNVLILHVLSPVPGAEWDIASILEKMANDFDGEIFSLESVGVPPESKAGKNVKGYYYTTDKKRKKQLEKFGLSQIEEGIIMGVTGALMVASKCSLTCIFAETHSNMPDSRAAAKIIEVLNDVLKLKIDTAPLIKTAVKFEEKVKTLLDKGKEASEQAQDKRVRYVG